jgi:hypothetical protein
MNVTGDPGRNARDNGAVRHIFRYNRPGTDLRCLSDGYARQDGGIAADRRMTLDQCGDDDPVRIGLQTAIRINGARVRVIGEHDPMADENTVFQRHAFADEGMAGDLAVFSDKDVFLDFDERADARSRADRAAIEIHEISMMDDTAIIQPYV